MNKNKRLAAALTGTMALSNVFGNEAEALTLHHTHLGTTATITSPDENFIRFCRDRLDGTIPARHEYDDLFRRLELIVRYFEARGHTDIVINTVSCFRSEATNTRFKNEGRQVASNSQHVHGTAMDFYLTSSRGRIPLQELQNVACDITRTEGYGGVGVYRGNGFLHLDVRPRTARNPEGKTYSDWNVDCARTPAVIRF